MLRLAISRDEVQDLQIDLNQFKRRMTSEPGGTPAIDPVNNGTIVAEVA